LCERWCPWDAIDMVKTAEVAQHVADKGGPPDYVQQNWDRLVTQARTIAELYVEDQAAKAKAKANK
jgi:electron transport complex protein RnfB